MRQALVSGLKKVDQDVCAEQCTTARACARWDKSVCCCSNRSNEARNGRQNAGKADALTSGFRLPDCEKQRSVPLRGLQQPARRAKTLTAVSLFFRHFTARPTTLSGLRALLQRLIGHECYLREYPDHKLALLVRVHF